MWIPECEWRYASAAQMRKADQYAIETLGIPGAVLMYNAGNAVATMLPAGSVGIVCGKGNNGGDGFVIALRVLSQGLKPRVVALAEADAYVGDAKLYRDIFTRMGGEITCATSDSKVVEEMENLSCCDVLVDAILGTGFTGDVRGLALAAISHWPKARTFAVDVPSGLNADTGVAHGACVRAEVTITFQRPKLGFQNPEARAYLGRVCVADIGIPASAFQDPNAT